MTRKNKRRAWSLADVRTLKQMARKKSGAPAIAKKLNRSEGAVRQKAFEQNCSLDTHATRRRSRPATVRRTAAPRKMQPASPSPSLAARAA